MPLLHGARVGVVDLDAFEQTGGAACLQAIVDASAKCAELGVATVAQRQHGVLHGRQILRITGQPIALGCLRMIGCIAFAGGADDAQQPRHTCELIDIDGVQWQCVRTHACRLQRGDAAFGQFTRKSGLACPDDQHAAGVCALCAHAPACTQQHDRAHAQVERQPKTCQLPAMRCWCAPPCTSMQAAQPADDGCKGKQNQPVAKPYAEVGGGHDAANCCSKAGLMDSSNTPSLRVKNLTASAAVRA